MPRPYKPIDEVYKLESRTQERVRSAPSTVGTVVRDTPDSLKEPKSKEEEAGAYYNLPCTD